MSKWRTRFARERLAGLNDLPRSGVPPKRSDDGAAYLGPVGCSPTGGPAASLLTTVDTLVGRVGLLAEVWRAGDQSRRVAWPP